MLICCNGRHPHAELVPSSDKSDASSPSSARPPLLTDGSPRIAGCFGNAHGVRLIWKRSKTSSDISRSHQILGDLQQAIVRQQTSCVTFQGSVAAQAANALVTMLTRVVCTCTESVLRRRPLSNRRVVDTAAEATQLRRNVGVEPQRPRAAPLRTSAAGDGKPWSCSMLHD